MTKKMFTKFQSPSLTIFKPNLNSMLSIYNRIVGIILFFIILVFLCVYFYIFQCALDNYHASSLQYLIVSDSDHLHRMDYDVAYHFENYSPYNFTELFEGNIFSKLFKFVVLNNFIQIATIIFLSFIISYHIIYSSFKIYTKSNKIFQIISSNINIVNDLYLDILKLVLILTFIIIIFFSLNIINNFTFSFLSIFMFIGIIIIKWFLYTCIKMVCNIKFFKLNK